MACTLFCITFALSLLRFAIAAGEDSAIENYDAEFPFNKHAFNTTRNWEMCVNVTEDVSPDVTVADYGKYLTDIAMNKSASTSDGASIRLAAGVYPVKTAIILPSNVCLVGMDMDRTILRVIDNANITAPVRGVIRSINSTRVTLRGFTLDCNSKMQKNTTAKEHFAKFGIFIQASSYTYIWDVRVKGALGYGFDPHGSDAMMGHHVAIHGCIADSCLKDGFKVSNINRVSLVSSIAVNNGRDGIRITKGSEIISLEENIVVDSGNRQKDVGSGIKVMKDDELEPKYIRMRNNRIHNAYYAGVFLDEANHVQIEKTTITNNVDSGSYCFKVKNSEEHTVFDNSCDANESKMYDRDGGDEPEKRCVGISADGACCPASCGTCGGEGCSLLLPKRGCCSSHIKDDKRNCMFSAAPCVM